MEQKKSGQRWMRIKMELCLSRECQRSVITIVVYKINKVYISKRLTIDKYDNRAIFPYKTLSYIDKNCIIFFY